MNLLFLSQVFPDAHSPVRGTFNLALCKALAEGDRVCVVSPRPWMERVSGLLRRKGRPTTPSEAIDAGIDARYPTYWHMPRVALHRAAGSMRRSLRSCFQRVAREFRPDAVLSYWAHPEGRVALDVAREWKVPAACIVGGSDVLLLPRESMKRRAEIVHVLRESDAIVTVSEGLRRACIELGAEEDRVHTIYQGIDPGRFSPGDQQPARRRIGLPDHLPWFVWVGRMAEVKRVDVLIDAAQRLHRRGFRFRLHLLGDGPLRKSLQSLSHNLGLDTVVHFHGAVGQDQLGDWYRAASATVLSSRSEGLPNVLRESLACGTPFVATDVGSIREAADPAWSILVPPGDAEAFATAMERILHPDYRLAAGEIPARTWSDCAQDISNLLSNRRGGRNMQRGAEAMKSTQARGTYTGGER